ncbi:MAG: glycosyltransferase family 2 protein [Actinomyces urogenitalis]|uniref:glycosyltransferase family 2 protein n=1 Tax=Actinomyces urogenitalis TaxID=103621 RepID=UPI0009DED6AD|nr:glycosyltransferase family 2 protein [Actinomyces urogenitalis]MDU5875326.1 glycosyltransferase family 2 protein [Actinomyces urogenitalis]
MSSGTTTSRPSARIVIVNWRRSDLTIRACCSIESQMLPGDRLIVVDNASGDGSPERLRAAGLEVVVTSTNLGFGAGVNAGARHMREEVLVLLNNDAVAHPGFLDALTAPLTQSEPVAATTALLLLAGRWREARTHEPALRGLDGSRWTRLPPQDADSGRGTVLVNSTGNLVDRNGNGYDRDWLTAYESLDANPRVFGICGGACAIKASVWRELDGFREDLFMYYEDTDLSWRLHERGYEVRYVASAIAEHEHAASSGAESPLFIEVNMRNRILVAAAHGPASMIIRALIRSCLRAARRSPASPEQRGLRTALAFLPRELRHRRRRRP